MTNITRKDFLKLLGVVGVILATPFSAFGKIYGGVRGEWGTFNCKKLNEWLDRKYIQAKFVSTINNFHKPEHKHLEYAEQLTIINDFRNNTFIKDCRETEKILCQNFWKNFNKSMVYDVNKYHIFWRTRPEINFETLDNKLLYSLVSRYSLIPIGA